jgi:hypothetical protein
MTKAELWLISQGRKANQETIDLLDEYLKKEESKFENLKRYIEPIRCEALTLEDKIRSGGENIEALSNRADKIWSLLDEALNDN